MIIKGKARGNGAQLGRYLVTKGENESLRVIEIRGVVASTVPGALLEMDALAQGARTKKPIYSASINTPAEERLTDEQRLIAVERLEKALGLSGQARVIVLHTKPDRDGKLREHCHIAWSRIDLDRMAAIPDSKNYHTHEKVARELEREFGLRPVRGVHAERDGQARPERTPSHAEMLQTERGAASPQDAKSLVTELWRRTDSGTAFKAALEDKGWILAQGDRRDFVVVDPGGGTHSLARRVEGAKAKDIRARMDDVDRDALPTVAQACQIQIERQPQRPFEYIQMGQALAYEEGKRRLALRMLWNAHEKDSEQLRSPENKTPAVAESFRWSAAEKTGKLGQPFQKDRGESAPAPTVAEAFKSSAEIQASHLRAERRDERFHEGQLAWKKELEERASHPSPIDRGLRVTDSATGLVMKLGDFLLDLLSGSSPPPRQVDPRDPVVRAERQLEELTASRRAQHAIENIRLDVQAGQNLKSEDIKNLTPWHQEQIRQFGDEAVRQMVEESRRQSERYWRDQGRERER